MAAAAVPAGIAALKLARHVRENQPFRQLLAHLAPADGAALAESQASPSENDLRQLQTLVQQRLAAAGINTSIRFGITSDALGQLQIAGDHPRQREIEQALLGDPEIAAAFHRLAASHQLTQAAQQHLQFAEQYVTDASGAPPANPPAAASFTVTINGDAIEVE